MIAHLHLLCIGIGHLSILPKSREGSWNKTIFLCIFPMILIYLIIQFSAAGFCFLVPFYIDPALSTLQYRYVGSIITLMSLLSLSIFVISSLKVVCYPIQPLFFVFLLISCLIVNDNKTQVSFCSFLPTNCTTMIGHRLEGET